MQTMSAQVLYPHYAYSKIFLLCNYISKYCNLVSIFLPTLARIYTKIQVSNIFHTQISWNFKTRFFLKPMVTYISCETSFFCYNQKYCCLVFICSKVSLSGATVKIPRTRFRVFECLHYVSIYGPARFEHGVTRRFLHSIQQGLHMEYYFCWPNIHFYL